MRRIKRVKKSSLSLSKESLKDKVFATIGGVLQPIVYSKNLIDGSVSKENVFLTPEKRLARRTSAKRTVSLTVPKVQDGVVINPIITFEYNKGFAEVTSGNNIKTWNASFSNNQLTMPTTANQPDIGLDGRGVNGSSPAYFSITNGDYMQLNTSVTVSGDFTIFLYAEPMPPVPNAYKFMRFLGNSSNNNMYLSIGEGFNESYNMSFASGSEIVVSATGYWQPSSKKILITVQRSGSTFYIRENGVQVATGSTPTSDFIFDQVGKLGNLSTTYNGSLYHLSIYDGYITTELENMEQSIIKQALLAKG